MRVCGEESWAMECGRSGDGTAGVAEGGGSGGGAASG